MSNDLPPIKFSKAPKPIRVRQMLGKYRIERKVGCGAFSTVFSAYDTIEGIRVALKIPQENYFASDLMDMFRKEVRTIAKLEHSNILKLKDASLIEGRLVLVTLLGNETLQDRLKRRISVLKAFDYTQQMLAAVAYAHDKKLIHCDIKPENFILFDDDHLCLSDFGIAKVSLRTVQGSGSGTIGHIAPEQAMGKPSARSDVFSLGLIIYRMLTGHWPQFPFDWPLPGASQLRRKSIHPDMIRFLKRSLAVRPHERFPDAIRMEKALLEILPKTIRHYKKKNAAKRK